jgi:4-hydroxy-tetrahydrodipicolinate synthase
MQITPFSASGELDLASLARAVEWQVGMGLGSLSALGMAGEFYKLSTDETEAVISQFLEAAGRCHTVVGVTGASAEVAVRLARHATSKGADALLVLPPYGIKPSSSGLIDYYAAIARAVDTPIMVQDGSDEIRAVIPFDVLLRLCREVPSVRYIKVEDTAPNPKITALRQALGDEVTLVCGSGGLLMLDAYERGAVGCISGAATADLMHEVDQAWRMGDRAEADRLYRRALPLIQFQCQSTELFIASEKRILRRRGLIEHDAVRQPGYHLDELERDLLDREVEALR